MAASPCASVSDLAVLEKAQQLVAAETPAPEVPVPSETDSTEAQTGASFTNDHRAASPRPEDSPTTPALQLIAVAQERAEVVSMDSASSTHTQPPAPASTALLCCLPAEWQLQWRRRNEGAAALLVQLAARRRLAVRERASRLIQRAWFMYNLRLDAADELDDLRRMRNLYAVFARVENRAATTVQHSFRRRVAERAATQQVEQIAVLRMQAAARGLLAREATYTDRSRLRWHRT